MGTSWNALTRATIFLTIYLLFAVSTPASAADGEDLFKKNCSMCHGADGKGFAVMKTPDMTDPKWQETHSDETISEFIRTGKAPMPAFPADKISDEELKAIIAHIRTLKKKATSEE